jgi:hypothetical protein
MPQQLPQIAVLGRRNPDAHLLELPAPQQLPQMLRVARVGLLLARLRRPDFGRVSDPQLLSQLAQQPLEPARRPARFHAHSHRLSRQAAVKPLRFPAMLQPALPPLSSFRVDKRNLLKPRMKITAYNPHVGSFPRALVLFSDNQCTRLGADLFMQSLSPPRFREGREVDPWRERQPFLFC